MHKPEDFPLSPLSRASWLWLWIPLLFALIVTVMGSMTASDQSSAVRVLLPSAIFISLLGLGLTWAMRRRHIRLDNRELHITATLYTRKVAVEAMDLAHARVVSLDERTDLKPRVKTNGFGLPGFHAGHFRLLDFTKAFCLITDRTRVLSLPLRDGSLILLSPEKPRVLLDRLRELADIPARR